MDWLTFWAKIVEAVAWPAAIVALVLFLRREIKTLLSLIRKLKAGPIEAEFEREVKELRTEADTELPDLLAEPAPSAKKQKLLLLAQVSPRSAILEAWRDIETTAKRIISTSALHVSPREASSPLAVTRAITKAQILTPEELALFHDLRALRNQASHVEDFSPTYESALHYIELAARLQATLAQHAGNEG